MTRLPDWERRLVDFLASRRGQPHAWGTNDCAAFCAAAVFALTGERPASHLDWSYRDEEGAERLLEKVGGIDAECRKIFGEPVPVLQARRGDVLVGRGRLTRMDLVGLCLGPVAVSPGECADFDTETKVRLRAQRAAREAGREPEPAPTRHGLQAVPQLVSMRLDRFDRAYRVG